MALFSEIENQVRIRQVTFRKLIWAESKNRGSLKTSRAPVVPDSVTERSDSAGVPHAEAIRIPSWTAGPAAVKPRHRERSDVVARLGI